MCGSDQLAGCVHASRPKSGTVSRIFSTRPTILESDTAITSRRSLHRPMAQASLQRRYTRARMVWLEFSRLLIAAIVTATLWNSGGAEPCDVPTF